MRISRGKRFFKETLFFEKKMLHEKIVVIHFVSILAHV